MKHCYRWYEQEVPLTEGTFICLIYSRIGADKDMTRVNRSYLLKRVPRWLLGKIVKEVRENPMLQVIGFNMKTWKIKG